MANIKISQLTNATTPLTGTEEVPIVQGGTTVKVAASSLGKDTNSSTLYIPYNNAGIFADSVFINDVAAQTLKTFSPALDFETGFTLDFQNGLYSLGDTYNSHYGVCLNVDDFNLSIKTKYAGQAKGFNLDYNNNAFSFGDFMGNNQLIIDANSNFSKLVSLKTVLLQTNQQSSTFELIDDGTVLLMKSTFIGTETGLLLDFHNNEYKFGDYDNGINYLSINVAANTSTLYGALKTILNSDSGNQTFELSSNNTIKSTSNGYNTGLYLDFANNSYVFGSFNAFGNDTAIYVDDAIRRIRFTSNIGGYNFYAMTTYASNAAALIAGLQVGDVYKFADGSLHIVY